MQMTIDDVQSVPFIAENEKPNGSQYKEYNVSSVNKHYLEAFQKGKYPNINTDKKERVSFNQYRCTINNFLETLSKDAAMVKREDIDMYLNSGANAKNKSAHLKSFFLFLLTNNVKNIQAKVSRDLLIKLIEM